MPVVINEFEVLDTQQEQAARREGAAPPAAPQRPDPQDLQRWLVEQSEQQLRLQAH